MTTYEKAREIKNAVLAGKLNSFLLGWVYPETYKAVMSGENKFTAQDETVISEVFNQI